MYWLAWTAADGAHGVCFGRWFGQTLKTFCLSLNIFLETKLLGKFNHRSSLTLGIFRTFLITVTWPRYPSVPLSMSGMLAAKHILFTWRRASFESHRHRVDSYLILSSTAYMWKTRGKWYPSYLTRSSLAWTVWRTRGQSPVSWYYHGKLESLRADWTVVRILWPP